MRLISLIVLLGLSNVALAAEPQGTQAMPPARGGVQQGAQGQAVPENAAKSVRDVFHLAQHMRAVAQMASDKGTTADIKDLASRMEQEYGKLETDITNWAQNNNVSLEEPGPTTYQAQIQKLQGSKGKMFDRDFLGVVSDENARLVKDIDQITRTSPQGDFKQMMEQAVPVLNKYAGEARRLEGKGA